MKSGDCTCLEAHPHPHERSCPLWSCPICGDLGYYLDERCRRDICDHGNFAVAHAPRETHSSYGKTITMKVTKRARVMPCPERPCRCKAGRARRAALLQEIQDQALELEALEQEKNS